MPYLTDSMSLDRLPIGANALVVAVVPPPPMSEWELWLTDLGFLPGVTVRVLRDGPFASDPLAVRVGDATFALRRAEAACIAVTTPVSRTTETINE
jgi:ferrous iron transport protein A